MATLWENASLDRTAPFPLVPSANRLRALWQTKKRFLIPFRSSLVAIPIYSLAAYIGLSSIIPGSSISVLWPPAGIAVALVILLGYGALPGIAVSIFIINFLEVHHPTIPLSRMVGNSLEAAVGCYVLRHVIGSGDLFQNRRQVLLFAALAASGPVLSALFGVFGDGWSGKLYGIELYYRVGTWWLENYLGVLCCAPALICWGRDHSWKYDRSKTIEAIGLIAGLVLTSNLIFGGITPSFTLDYPVEYLCLPFLLWAIFRFDERVACVVLFALAFLCIQGTKNSLSGPFYRGNPSESIALLQLFLGTNALLTFILLALLRERSEMERRLARSNSELERFAYLASHDLQEPLRTVNSFCGLIERKYKGKFDAEGEEYLTLIGQASRRMHLMINSLLDYSRLGRTLKVEWVDTREVADQALANLQAAISESKARLTFHFMPTVSADRRLLGMVFQNLIGNAIKFHGTEPPQIDILAEPDGQKWIFHIKDNGIGIEPQHFSKIFVLFQRAVGDESHYPGSGVGLALSKKIVEAHGGRIWLESVPGKGSDFCFSLSAGSPIKL